MGTRRYFVGVAILLVTASAVLFAFDRPEWKRTRARATEAERSHLEARAERLRASFGTSAGGAGAGEAEGEEESLRDQEVEREIGELTTRLVRLRFEERRARARGHHDALETLRRESEQIVELRAEAEARLARWRRRERGATDPPGRSDLAEVERRLSRGLADRVRAVAVRPQGVVDARTGGRPLEDRCATCHQAAARAERDWGEATWLRAHPRRDLFVARDSPHPVVSFGCALCHGGVARALDASTAGHGADGDIDPRGERACLACHGEVPETVAGRVDRHLVDAGCDACHGLPGAGEEPLPRPGAPLEVLAARWTASGVAAALEQASADGGHRPSYPRLDALDRAALGAAVAARARGGPAWADREVPEGDAVRGRAVFVERGCVACHALAPASGASPGTVRSVAETVALARRPARISAPSWWSAVLEDPARLGVAGMPDLRLTDDERRDVVAWLAAETGRDAAGEGPGAAEAGIGGPDEGAAGDPSEIDEGALDARLAEVVARGATLEETAALVASLDVEEKLARLGEDRLARSGCGGCHFDEGSSAHTAPDLASGTGPLRRPDGARAWHRTPWTPEPGFDVHVLREVERALESPPDRQIAGFRSAEEGAVLDDLRGGRRVAVRLGCGRCHALDAETPAPTRAPPLAGMGSRLRPEWLTAFLADPSAARRPHLEERMPTYDLPSEVRLLLVRWMVRRDGAALLVDAAPRVDPVLRAAGEIEFGILCGSCHGPETPAAERAPSYESLDERLRPDWLVPWLLDPAAVRHGTTMPALLVDAATGGSAIEAALESPIFAQRRAALVRLFPDREAYERHVGDPAAVAQALAAHLLAGDPARGGS